MQTALGTNYARIASFPNKNTLLVAWYADTKCQKAISGQSTAGAYNGQLVVCQRRKFLWQF